MQVSNIVGELLAFTPKLKQTIKNKPFINNLLYCVERVAKNNINAFARFLEVESMLIHGVTKNNQHIQLDSLVKIVKKLNTPVKVLFLRKLSGKYYLPQVEITRKPSRNDKLIILKKALIDPRRPSLNDLAQEHGFLSISSFRRADAELCKQITARNTSNHPRKTFASKKHNTEIIERELYQALEEKPPPTLLSVANKLGYKTGTAISNRFPEISKKLTKKRSEYLKQLNRKLEKSLIKALNDFPPLSLITVAKKLGYKESSGIRERFPELCHAISIRFKEYNPRFEIASKALFAALTQDPPPTISSISKSLNVCDTFLYKCNSVICHQISERYRQFKKHTSLQKRRERHEMIRNIALELHAKGIYPSAEKVSQLLPASFNRVHDSIFLTELRKSLP